MVKEEISFILGFVRGGAIFMGAGEFSFEIDYEGVMLVLLLLQLTRVKMVPLSWQVRKHL